ncbi:MAG TPA: HEAT repeat domain-containing protein [Vicinamibacterales bacterium]|jgi:HEAT repeat protein
MTATKTLAFLLAASTTVAAQQMTFEDVVRNLRNPDPKARLAAIRLLREAKYPEAVAPMAPLVVDQFDDVQLEAISAELSFFLPDQDVRTKKMVGYVIEKRSSGVALQAFDLGPLAVWPRPAPPELLDALLTAIDDHDSKVRLEAIYAFGIVARPPISTDQQAKLIRGLDHYDPAIRSGVARVIERQKFPGMGDALIKAVNDSQPEVRFAAMRALGAVHEARAIPALTEQLAFYKKGEGAWSALHGLALIGAGSSVPVFTERLQDKDPYMRRSAAEGLGRTGDAASIESLERMVTTDESVMVRAACAFALQKLGRNYSARLVDLMNDTKAIPSAQEYLVELGPPMAGPLVPRLQEPGAAVRAAVADVLGAIGDVSTLPALEAVAKDTDPAVATAASRAIARIKSR